MLVNAAAAPAFLWDTDFSKRTPDHLPASHSASDPEDTRPPGRVRGASRTQAVDEHASPATPDGDLTAEERRKQDAIAEDAISVALMERVRDGDDQAFEKLVMRHQQAVIGTIVRMTGKVRDAEDMAQQVFFRVWRSAPHYQATARFSTWLFTITRNVVFNENRRMSRRKEMSIEDLSERAPERTPPDTESTPDSSLLEGELHREIDKALAQLPEKQRLALVLRRYEEMPYEDIGEILGLSLPAVKSLIFRARNTLRGLLAPYLRIDE